MNYDDIIGRERPEPSRQRMSLHDRAAQFAPFAALTGFEELIENTEKFSQEYNLHSDDE